ncbi:AI-2E family transporter [Gephyromycinifex aptenodytis]|uniref:AI-2E family transporter n=1 Tax=Gephyromycinifex aptenodytis TaxID=2716227 RepID=UPI001444BE93|nr:AI-2E family transporter [Gephyromycinifex aptenodytis]
MRRARPAPHKVHAPLHETAPQLAMPLVPEPSLGSTRDAAPLISRRHLPYPVLVAGAWSGILILLAAASYLLAQVVAAVSIVVVPLAVAVLLAALLHPLVSWLDQHSPLPRPVTALLALLLLLCFIVAGSTVAISQIAAGAPKMTEGVQSGVAAITSWLRTGPLHVTGGQLAAYLTQAQLALKAHISELSTGFFDVGSRAVEMIAGTFICLIATFFFLCDGAKIWAFLVSFLPRATRRPLFEATRRGWVSVSAYARTQVVVAAVDSLGIALGAFALGLPLLGSIVMLVFLSAFVPIVGVIVAGIVPTLIALVALGPVSALIMLGVVVCVHFLEAHVLQPFLMGHAVALHPLAVIVVVAVGAYLYGISGALFAVPVLAFLNATGRYLAGADPFPELGTRTGDDTLVE